MKKIAALICVLLIAALAAAGCTPYHAQGAGTGAAVGGVAGAVLDHRNPWRGGLIGAALGAFFGATIADISVRGQQEAYRTGRPVEYHTEDGRGLYRAEPDGDYYYERGGSTKCRKVREKTWEDGRLVRNQTREVCESARTEPGYDERYR